MLKTILTLPDGTELTSGVGQTNNLRSCTLTECVNSGEELTLGSVCAAMMEVTAQTPMGGLALTAGDDVTLFKMDSDGIRHQAGLFALEKPTRPSGNLMKLTGYDRVTKLDKDLTAWLKNLDGWPYDLLTFARMVCEACGLVLVTESIPNGDYPVQKFEKEVSGRQLMAWIGQIACRFCRATPFGDIELAWYTPSGINVKPTGDRYYIQRGLTFEDYQVAPIEAVQVRLTDSEDGAPIPTVPDGTNSYVIMGNPIFTAVTQTVLDNIQAELDKLPNYTPCRIAMPAALDLYAGHTLDITDINGKTITALVMSKTQKGQRDTIECTGSPRRDSVTAQNNKSPKDVAAENERKALMAGKDALKNATPEEVFNALTDGGTVQGFYLHEGKVYINAEFVSIVNLVANSIVAGILASADGSTYFDLDNALLRTQKEMLGDVDGVMLNGGAVVGTHRTTDETADAPVFQIYNNANGVFFVGMSGTPINIISDGGVKLGTEDAPLYINGKRVGWLDSGQGYSYLVAPDTE